MGVHTMINGGTRAGRLLLVAGVVAACTSATVSHPAASGAASQPAPAAGQTLTSTPASRANALAGGGTFALQVGGIAGVPTNAEAAALNVTVTSPTGFGYVTVWPCGKPQPLASNVNFAPGQTIANMSVAALGAGGRVCFYSPVATHLVVDAAGYFPSGSSYTP